MTSRQRNTNTSEQLVIEETGERGRDLGPTRGRERGSVATRANTTAAVGTQDTAVTGAETQQTSSGLIVTDALSLNSNTKSDLACSLNDVEFSSLLAGGLLADTSCMYY